MGASLSACIIPCCNYDVDDTSTSYTGCSSYQGDGSEFLVDKSILEAIKQRGSNSDAAAMLDSINDYELVIRVSKELEGLLEHEFQVHGCRGLHECISAVERRPDLKGLFLASGSSDKGKCWIREMRYLATIRNKLVHDRTFTNIPDRDLFLEKFEHSCQQLSKIIHLRRQQRRQSKRRKSNSKQ